MFKRWIKGKLMYDQSRTVPKTAIHMPSSEREPRCSIRLKVHEPVMSQQTSVFFAVSFHFSANMIVQGERWHCGCVSNDVVASAILDKPAGLTVPIGVEGSASSKNVRPA